MQITNLQLAVLLFLIVDIFVYYKYMDLLFGTPRVSNTIILISYTGYYLMLSALYLFMNVPVVLMIFNSVVCTGITFFYRGTFTKRILSSVLYCLVMICIEFIYYMLFEHTSAVFTRTRAYGPVWQATVVKLTEYIAVYLLFIFFDKKNDVNLPKFLWLRIILIPIVSLCTIGNLVYFNLGIQKTVAMIIVILIVNITVILLYIEITAVYAEKYKHLILKKQNEYYINQFELMSDSLRIRNSEKHDFKNHLSVIAALVQRNAQEEAGEYIASIMNVYNSVKGSYNSGNLVIDSILNYKAQEAEQSEIKLNAALMIPENLQVNSIDVTTILGNIIDNAINATKKLEKDRFIDLKIKYDKGRLLITVNNPYNGEIKYESDKLVTLHPDRENHGIGLNNVRMILEKYNGTLDIEHTDNIFCASLMMFL